MFFEVVSLFKKVIIDQWLNASYNLINQWLKGGYHVTKKIGATRINP